MRKQIYLTILVSIFFLFIILISGCGGDEDTGMPSSTGQNYGSIIIKVTWPSDRSSGPGKCVIFSGSEENSLTASMPGDTSEVWVKVYDENKVHLFGENGVSIIPGATVQFVIEPVPAGPVIINAAAYNKTWGKLSEVEDAMTVEVGNNWTSINLGDYNVTLEAKPLRS